MTTGRINQIAVGGRFAGPPSAAPGKKDSFGAGTAAALSLALSRFGERGRAGRGGGETTSFPPRPPPPLLAAPLSLGRRRAGRRRPAAGPRPPETRGRVRSPNPWRSSRASLSSLDIPARAPPFSASLAVPQSSPRRVARLSPESLAAVLARVRLVGISAAVRPPRSPGRGPP